uniref:Uncharacterized protein n=1 Tax=Amphiprion percula TaxID=161767 RepID=A0A3P8SZ01_AMPPE
TDKFTLSITKISHVIPFHNTKNINPTTLTSSIDCLLDIHNQSTPDELVSHYNTGLHDILSSLATLKTRSGCCQLTRLTRAQQSLGQGIGQLTRALKSLGQGIGQLTRLTRAQQSLGQGIGQLTRALKSLGQGIGQLTRALKSLGQGIGQLTRLTRAQQSLGQGIGQLTRALQSLGQGIGQLTRAVQSLGQGIGQLTRALQSLGQGIGQLTRAQQSLGQGIGQLTRAVLRRRRRRGVAVEPRWLLRSGEVWALGSSEASAALGGSGGTSVALGGGGRTSAAFGGSGRTSAARGSGGRTSAALGGGGRTSAALGGGEVWGLREPLFLLEDLLEGGSSGYWGPGSGGELIWLGWKLSSPSALSSRKEHRSLEEMEMGGDWELRCRGPRFRPELGLKARRVPSKEDLLQTSSRGLGETGSAGKLVGWGLAGGMQVEYVAEVGWFTKGKGEFRNSKT